MYTFCVDLLKKNHNNELPTHKILFHYFRKAIIRKVLHFNGGSLSVLQRKHFEL